MEPGSVITDTVPNYLETFRFRLWKISEWNFLPPYESREIFKAAVHDLSIQNMAIVALKLSLEKKVRVGRDNSKQRVLLIA